VDEVTLSLLSKCIQTKQHQEQILKYKGIGKIEKYIFSKQLKIKEACLECISQLTKDNKIISKSLTQFDEILKLVMDINPSIRLMACQWYFMIINSFSVVNFYKNDLTPEIDISEVILPTIIKLLNENGKSKEQVPIVLADLISGNEELQQMVCDSDAIEKISSFLMTSDQISETMKYV
jgi:hypothetical protein